MPFPRHHRPNARTPLVTNPRAASHSVKTGHRLPNGIQMSGTRTPLHRPPSSPPCGILRSTLLLNPPP
eukprot:11067965-Lingulodinium_polyedra.AAC.1